MTKDAGCLDAVCRILKFLRGIRFARFEMCFRQINSLIVFYGLANIKKCLCCSVKGELHLNSSSEISVEDTDESINCARPLPHHLIFHDPFAHLASYGNMRHVFPARCDTLLLAAFDRSPVDAFVELPNVSIYA